MVPFSIMSPSEKSILANAPSNSPVAGVEKVDFLVTTLEQSILADVGRWEGEKGLAR